MSRNGLLVAGLAEEALAGPEHDWVDHQPDGVVEDPAGAEGF
jgi:hypothetical protein